ncbi:MAG TPA: hypothetical protein VFD35_12565 [Pricia sp.]|nr:hypothetical protein [Pricia sp.]
MAKIKEKRTQVLYFETSPEELRKVADILEKTEPNLVNSKATFFLNEDDDEDNFNEEICIKFIKSK